MFKLFNKNSDLEKEWNEKGSTYAREINEMMEYGNTHGWENWKGKEPVDTRDDLANQVISLLRTANKNGKNLDFRNRFPPAHSPFINYFNEKGQSIEDLCFISTNKISFIVGTPYQKRQAYLLTDQKLELLHPSIISIGKSHINEIFAIATKESITTHHGWGGKEIGSFIHPRVKDLPITQLLPFNNGLEVLLVSSDGIFLLTENHCNLIHPVPDLTDDKWESNIDMGHASISPDNKYIALGDQCSDHRILDNQGTQIAEIGPQSSYPHFSIFSKDGQQVIMNSCHFYNGITIGVNTEILQGVKIQAYSKDERYKLIDDNCRVYAGVAVNGYYIIGDAHGYIWAISKSGEKLWRHFLGSTICGMTISSDEKTLWVSSFAGIIHKLQLGNGHRDNHTIGNGNHYEEFRLLIWKNEPTPLIW